MRPFRGLAGLVIIALAVCPIASANVRAASRAALLDVPYLSQPPRLCGGAAVSMVLRYWGAQDVFPQDFASLVDPAEQGIRAGVLADAVSRRGWHALVVGGETTRDADWLAEELAKGRPVIALIEDRPRTFHYVVVVGATTEDVVYHDPARAPFRTMPRAAFERIWDAAARWTLLILPNTAVPVAAPGAPPADVAAVSVSAVSAVPEPASRSCSALVAHHVTLARAGQIVEAERGLLAATMLCPTDARGYFELGGIRFLQKRYADAETLAEHSAVLAPADTALWELIATSRYLQNDLAGALEAWNHLGRPHADVVSAEGLERLDHPVAIRAIALEPRDVITRDAFRRAERRLRDLPSLKSATLRFEPAPQGTARVHAVLDERSVLPRGLMGWGAVGVNAAFKREIRVPIANALRQGEVWDIRYRWKENRPRLRIGFAAPAPRPLTGVFNVEALWERQAYVPVDDPRREERRRIGVTLTDWLTGGVRWTIGGAADQFDDREYLAVHGLVDTRWMDDLVTASASLGYWTPTNGADPFTAADVQAAWRSTADVLQPGWHTSAGVFAVHSAAPLAVWPVAGSGESRGPLLRAHSLHDRGVIVSDTFGQRLAFANGEYRHPVYSRRGASAAIAGFIDISRAWRHPFDDALLRTHVDVGAGLRIAAPGGDDQLRLDLGYGLRDGEFKFSAGYIVPWGR